MCSIKNEGDIVCVFVYVCMCACSDWAKIRGGDPLLAFN